MPSPEFRPVLPQAEIKKGKKGRFAIKETHIPGVSLRTEPGFDVDILKQTIEKFHALAKGYFSRKLKIDKLTDQQKEPDGEIKALAQTHEGLRGIQSEPDKFYLNVFPRDSVIWNHPLLKESLGIAYSSVVREDLIVTISVPTGFQTEKGPIQGELLGQVLTQALLDLGLPKEDLNKVMSTAINQRVDEETLKDMIESGKISLLEGTRQTSRTWAIRVDTL